MKWKEFIIRVYTLGCLKNCQQSIFFTKDCNSAKNRRYVSAKQYALLHIIAYCLQNFSFIGSNCRRSYPETNMLKNLIQGLNSAKNCWTATSGQYALGHLMVLLYTPSFSSIGRNCRRSYPETKSLQTDGWTDGCQGV